MGEAKTDRDAAAERRRRALLVAGAAHGAPSVRALATLAGLNRETLGEAIRGRAVRSATAAKLAVLLGADVVAALFNVRGVER